MASPSTAFPVQVRCCSHCRAIYRSDYLRCPTDGAVIELVDGDPLIGETLGEHYVIEACVGEGAMGRVYRAHHARLERRAFAVKVLLGDLAATIAMRLRFAQEADAASGLDHPNVVSVADFGKSEAGLLYLVMDYVEGPMLGDVIATEGPLAAARVIGLARQMCLGLAHAHDHGLIHRDFKPDNVILANGVPRILDFGLAIAADPAEGAARLTSVGVTVGTPIYAAPEQAATGTIDHRADLFALGVTMYEMLAGIAPFSGNLAEILYRNATEAPPPIGERMPGVIVPPGLEAIVRRLMEKEPADRFASARDVITALDACDVNAVAPPAVVAAPVAIVEPRASIVAPAPRASRPTWVLPAIGVGAIALAVAAVVMLRPSAKPSSAAAVTIDAGLDAASRVAEVAVLPIDPAPIAPPPTDPAPIATPPTPIDPTPAVRTATRSVRAAIDPPPPTLAIAIAAPIDAGVPPIDAAPPPPPIDAAPPPPRVDAAPAPPPPAAPLRTTAAVGVGKLDIRGGLSNATVRRAIDREAAALRACYRDAARAAGKSPATSVAITLTIDEQGSAQDVRGAGAALPDLAACSARALRGVRTDAPDVGTVAVTVTITFQPEAP